MRVAPLGAYFADDLDKVVEQAERSAVTTHCHREAIAGAIAVGLAAALAWQFGISAEMPSAAEFLHQIHQRTPQSATESLAPLTCRRVLLSGLQPHFLGTAPR
jgi:ADP-ribosylglycohydrolase